MSFSYATTRYRWDEARTGATLVLLGIGLIVLGLLARPLTKERTLLIVVMFLSYLVALNVKFISDYFQLVMPATWTWWLIGFAVAVGALILIIGPRFIPWWNEGVAAQALPRQDVAAATVGDRAGSRFRLATSSATIGSIA